MVKSVRLSDIASILNVSTVTVSRALAGQKGVSEEMREKIKSLAQEMGYQTPSAKANRKQRSYNIGVLISERYFNQYESYYLQVYQVLATEAMYTECFTLLEIVSMLNEQKTEMPKLLKEDKVDGLIIIGRMKDEYMDKLDQVMKVPLMCLDFYDFRRHYDAVVSDSFYGMYQLTNYLFDLGHTDIAYVGTLLYTGSITDRYFGYCKALLEHGQKVREDWVIDDRSMETGDARSTDALRLPENMPTAFVCNCDLTAGVLVEALKRQGLRVPEDISVVGFDNYLYPSICSLGITSYAVDIREMSKTAINKLLLKMSGESCNPGLHIVDGHIVFKESTRKFKKRKD